MPPFVHHVRLAINIIMRVKNAFINALELNTGIKKQTYKIILRNNYFF